MRHVRTPLIASVLFVTTIAHAAWLGPSGNPVAPTFHGRPVALYRDGGSGVFVAYQGLDVPGGGSIRLQHVLGDGTIAPGWPAEGAVVCSLAVTTELGQLKAISDGAGGALLVWDENFWLTSGTFYVQHVLASGARAGSWPARGRAVLPSGTLYSPESVADGAGGVLFVWSAGAQILSQRIRGDGTNAPGYPATGKVLLQLSGAGTWSGPAVASAHGGGFWLSALLAGGDSLTTPWAHRIWRLGATGALDLTWAGDDGNGFIIPTPSNALASGLTTVLDDGGNGAFVLMSVGTREVVTHVLSDQSIDPVWPGPLLDLGSIGDFSVSQQGTLALDGAGGLYAQWPSENIPGASASLRRARIDGTLDPDWTAPVPISPDYQPVLFADAAGVYASGMQLLSCPEQDCSGVSAIGRWSANGSTPAGWPETGGAYRSPGEYALPDSAYGGVVAMVGDGGGEVFVAWTTPDVRTVISYGIAATVRVMRFQAAGPVAGVGSRAEGPLAIRGTRFTREGIRCSISGAAVAELMLFDLLGRRVSRAEVAPGASDVLVPGTGALAPGLYLVRVRAGTAEAHAKVFVVR